MSQQLLVVERDPDVQLRPVIVQTLDELEEILPVLANSAVISLSMKSDNLGPKGTNSVIAIAPAHLPELYVIDVLTLRKKALYHQGSNLPSLASTLQSRRVKKLVFDVRNVSAALYHGYNVKLFNVLDVQLLELATRKGGNSNQGGNANLVAGMNRALESSKIFREDLTQIFTESRTEFTNDHVSQKGGKVVNLTERPIKVALQYYAILDIAYLARLYNHFLTRLGPEPLVWMDRCSRETVKRITASRHPSYIGQGPKFKFGPWDWKDL